MGTLDLLISSILRLSGCGTQFAVRFETLDLEEAARAARVLSDQRREDNLSSWSMLDQDDYVLAQSVLVVTIVMRWSGQRVDYKTVKGLLSVFPERCTAVPESPHALAVH